MTINNDRTKPAITIGMPVYNGENYIREAIDSALAQTFEDFELIISDNASTDGTQAICLDYASRDPRIRYIRQPENIGPVRNFKLVANEASGTYFTWLAHDDRLKPDYLEIMVEYIRRHPQVVLAVSDFSKTDANGKVTSQEIIKDIREDVDWNKRLFYFFEFPTSNIYIAIYGVMKTEVCRKVLRKSPNRKTGIGGEIPILCRFAVAGEIVSLPMILREKRRHSTSYDATMVAYFREKSLFRTGLFSLNIWTHVLMQQLGTLLASTLPLRFKVAASARLIYGFTAHTFRRVRYHLARIIKKPV